MGCCRHERRLEIQKIPDRRDAGPGQRPLAAEKSNPLGRRKAGLYLAQQLLIVSAVITAAIVALASGVAVENRRWWRLQLLGAGFS